MQIQQWAPKIYVPLLVIHVAILVMEPARTLSWSYGLVLCVLALTIVLCWRRLRLSVTIVPYVLRLEQIMGRLGCSPSDASRVQVTGLATIATQ